MFTSFIQEKICSAFKFFYEKKKKKVFGEAS